MTDAVEPTGKEPSAGIGADAAAPVVVFLHTIPLLVEVFDDLAVRLLPGVRSLHVVDEPALELVRRHGGLDAAATGQVAAHAHLAEALGAPDPCIGCHEDKGAAWNIEAFEKWYPRAAARRPRFSEAFRAGRAREPEAAQALARILRDQTEAGIVRATALRLLAAYGSERALLAVGRATEDADALVRAAAVEGLSTIVRPGSHRSLQARKTAWLAPLIEDCGVVPYHLVRRGSRRKTFVRVDVECGALDLAGLSAKGEADDDTVVERLTTRVERARGGGEVLHSDPVADEVFDVALCLRQWRVRIVPTHRRHEAIHLAGKFLNRHRRLHLLIQKPASA